MRILIFLLFSLALVAPASAQAVSGGGSSPGTTGFTCSAGQNTCSCDGSYIDCKKMAEKVCSGGTINEKNCTDKGCSCVMKRTASKSGAVAPSGQRPKTASEN